MEEILQKKQKIIDDEDIQEQKEQSTQNDKADEIKSGEQQDEQYLEKVGHQKLKPYPVAGKQLTIKLLDLVHQAMNYKQLKKGVNESMKFLHRGQSELVILAVDCDPIEIVMGLPGLCDEKNVPYCFISGQAALGRACGIKRPVVAATIIFNEGSQLNSQIMEMKDKVDQLFI